MVVYHVIHTQRDTSKSIANQPKLAVGRAGHVRSRNGNYVNVFD